MKTSTLYTLVSENLTHLGGPMGSQHTYNNWTRYFSTADAAKAAAAEDFGEPLIWHEDPDGWSTPDMGYVMYRIEPVDLEG